MKQLTTDIGGYRVVQERTAPKSITITHRRKGMMANIIENKDGFACVPLMGFPEDEKQRESWKKKFVDAYVFNIKGKLE